MCFRLMKCFFFFQAEDGIRDVRTWLEFRRVLFRSDCGAPTDRRVKMPRCFINCYTSTDFVSRVRYFLVWSLNSHVLSSLYNHALKYSQINSVFVYLPVQWTLQCFMAACSSHRKYGNRGNHNKVILIVFIMSCSAMLSIFSLAFIILPLIFMHQHARECACLRGSV